MEQTFKQTLAERNLVVLPPFCYIAPVATGEKHIQGGSGRRRRMVADLLDQRVVGSLR